MDGFKYTDDDVLLSLNNFSHAERIEKREKLRQLEENLNTIYNSKQKMKTIEKGKVLEEYFNLVLEFNSNLINISPNVKTATNELDIHISLKGLGKAARLKKMIPEYIPDSFIIECKNYKSALNVTYVNKFHSILVNAPYSFGLLLSYSGITGEKHTGWRDSLGFIKKVNLLAFHTRNKLCKNNESCVLQNQFPILCYSNGFRMLELTTKYNCNFFDWISNLVEDIKLDVTFL